MFAGREWGGTNGSRGGRTAHDPFCHRNPIREVGGRYSGLRIPHPEWRTMRTWIGALLIAALPGIAGAQSLGGEYVFQSPNGPVRLVLEQGAGNVVTGVLRGADGSELRLQGELDAVGRVIGTISVGGGTGWFAAGIVN